MTVHAASAEHEPAPETISYPSAAFEEAVRRAVTRLEKRQGTRFLFAGASKGQCQKALASMTEQSALNVYQFALPNLIGERYVETQGNLREAFDKADEEAALLVFDGVEALFAPTPQEGAPKENEHTPVDYLFERMKAFTSIVVVCRREAEHGDAARQLGADVVVEFAS